MSGQHCMNDTCNLLGSPCPAGNHYICSLVGSVSPCILPSPGLELLTSYSILSQRTIVGTVDLALVTILLHMALSVQRLLTFHQDRECFKQLWKKKNSQAHGRLCKFVVTVL